MDLIQINKDNMACCCDICEEVKLLFTQSTPISGDVFLTLFDEANGCSKTTLTNLLSSALVATDDQDCTDKKLIGSIDIAGTITQFFESVTGFGTPIVDATTDPNNVEVSLPFTNEDCLTETVDFTIPIPKPVSTFDSIDLKFDANGDLVVEAVYTDDDGNTSTITDATPVTLPPDYVEYTGDNIIPTTTPDAGVDTRVLLNGDRYDWNGTAWVLIPSPDTFGTVLTATAALTTTNEVDVAIGDFYIEFPDGTTWADPVCPAEMTRAALIALRNAGELNPQCHYIITDASVDGNLGVEKILIHALDANTLSGCYIKTVHDNTAWVGSYDIDTNDVERVFDHLNRNEVVGNGAILVFPFGNTSVTENVVHHSTLTVTGGSVNRNNISGASNVTVSAGNFNNNTVNSDANVTSAGNTNRNIFSAQSNTTINSGDFLENEVKGDATVISSTTGDVDNNVFKSGSNTTINSGNFDANEVHTDANVVSSGVSVARNSFYAASNTTINSGDFRNNQVQNDATVVSSTTGDIDSNTFGNLSNSNFSNASNFDNNSVNTDANVTMTGGSVLNCKFEQLSNYVMSGGVLRESTVGQDADVTIIGQDNYENVFGNSTVYRQVGTGYIRYSTIEGTTTWTNGNTNVSNVNSYVSTINTTGSAGTISNSTFHRVIGTNMQNVVSLTITDSTINNYSSFTINGAARLYLYRSSLTDYGRVLIAAGSRIDASYTNVSNNSYIQSSVSGGFLTINNTTVTNISYARNTTANAHTISNSRVEASSNMRFDGTATGCRIYYSVSASGTSMYHTTGAVNNYMYYVQGTSAAQIYTQTSTNVRMYYCSANSYSYMRAIGNATTVYMYYCNSDARGYVQALNNVGVSRMYGVDAAGQSIAELRGSTGNLYYSNFSAYFYAYVTRTTGTTSGAFGQGRRSAVITDTAPVAPFASGAAWSNI